MVKVFIKKDDIKVIYIQDADKEAFVKDASEKGYKVKESTNSDGETVLNLTQNSTMSLKEALKAL